MSTIGGFTVVVMHVPVVSQGKESKQKKDRRKKTKKEKENEEEEGKEVTGKIIYSSSERCRHKWFSMRVYCVNDVHLTLLHSLRIILC